MIKFPSIEQFRNVIRHVRTHAQYAGKDENGDVIFDQSKPIPTLKFRGTVKLHGTNAGIVYDNTLNTFTYQSRERELSLTSDNAGFMLAQMKNEEIWRDVVNQAIFELRVHDQIVEKVAIFGEWCGSGIQKGVALTELPKMFVVFAVKVVYIDGSTRWLPIGEFDIHLPEDRIFNIDTFPTYEIDIDFNHPELAQNKMIEITEEVEKECPVGKYFGVSGIGEGVVWTCVSDGWLDSGTWFKVKGEKHSVSKVRTLAAVDVEAVATIKAFVDSVVTEARLEQGLDNLVREQLKPVEMTSMGDFIRWVFNDVIKEEQDTIVASGIDPKKLGGPIANAARPWFVKKVNEGVNL
jgi:RNA ligase